MDRQLRDPELVVAQMEQSDALQLAIARQNEGHLDYARRVYELMLERYPSDPDCHHNLAVIHMQQGGFVMDALPHFAAAWKVAPEHPQYSLSYMRALVLAGQHELAAQVHADGQLRGLKWPPLSTLAVSSQQQARSDQSAPGSGPDPRSLNALYAQVESGNASGVEAQIRELTVRFPGNGDSWKLLGHALWKQDKTADALQALREAVRLEPRDHHARSNFARVLRASHLLAESEVHHAAAVQLKPDDVGYLGRWAHVLRQLGRYGDSEAALRRVLELRPGLAMAHADLGQTLFLQDRLEEAVKHLRKALSADPMDTRVRIKLVDCLKGLALYGEAEALLRKGLRLKLDDPADQQAMEHAMADVLSRQGRSREAREHHLAAIKSNARDAAALGALLFHEHYLPESTPEAMLEDARTWGRQVAAKVQHPYSSWTCTQAPSRLRVGLVSGDLRRHPVGYFLESVIAHADPKRIEWICYPTISDMDDLSEHLRSKVSAWSPLAGLDDAAAAERIRADGIHVLVDLAGHTAHNRVPMFALRPAPVQATWLGYFATTGLDAIDFLIADPTGVPEDQQWQFVERIWYLPDTRLCFSPPRTDLPVAPSPAISRGHICFGSFQNAAKINDVCLDAWARVLKACPGATLRIQNESMRSAESRAALQLRLRKSGIESSRLVPVASTRYQEYLGAHAEVDILLDTFPYPGGTTTCDALWMGVPTITLAGRTLIGRQGASLLTAAGLKDWIVDDVEGMVDTACSWASRIDRLASLRAGLRDQVRDSPLFDAARFARNLEDALWGMWETTGRPRLHQA